MKLPAQLVLSELELDALTEVINIGVSRAAVSLRTMVDSEVLLSVPSIAVVSRDQATQIMKERGIDGLVAIRQAFDGDICGRALLIFPEAKSLELVRTVTGGDLALEDLIVLEHEAVAEIGNIILNACLGTIANMLQRSLKVSLPEVIRGAASDVFSRSGTGTEEAVLFLYIDFSVSQRDIRGYIAFLMDLPALAALRALLGEFIDRTTGSPDEIHVAQ